MARPRFTTRFTLRLDPTLRHSLQSEADAKGDDFADHVRGILVDHAARRLAERGTRRELIKLDRAYIAARGGIHDFLRRNHRAGKSSR